MQVNVRSDIEDFATLSADVEKNLSNVVKNVEITKL